MHSPVSGMLGVPSVSKESAIETTLSTHHNKNDPLRNQLSRIEVEKINEEISSLLEKPTFREQQEVEFSKQLISMISTPTFRQKEALSLFRNKDVTPFREFCQYGTKEDCTRERITMEPCNGIHFRRLIFAHTDLKLGDCSYLDTCRHMRTCKYVHYEIDDADVEREFFKKQSAGTHQHSSSSSSSTTTTTTNSSEKAQWINCDIRSLDMSVLGKFGVILADPPWDIHMELPYGTLSDDEMRQLPIATLQDDGLICLWVTGRVMELGRECLKLWGYHHIEELVWVKINQLQRIIRTGRTGHWLNHSKEHCLIGVKGTPKMNACIDCDVIVAEVRETSRKPDEIYDMVERLLPGSRKLELFGRPHNIRPGWITLGNQLASVMLCEDDCIRRYNKHYPDTPIQKGVPCTTVSALQTNTPSTRPSATTSATTPSS